MAIEKAVEYPRGLRAGRTLKFVHWRRQASISTCIPLNSLAKEVSVPSGPPIKISTRQEGEATILDLVGDITLFNSPEIRKVLILLLKDRGVAQLFVNMTGVKYVDSSGIASLVEGLKIARDRSSRFVLYGLSKPATTVLELTHLLHVFEVHVSEQEALKAPPPAANKLAFSAGDGTGESA
jgi:anti-sigma B factor antagonist